MDVVFHVATAAPTAANAHNEALMSAVNVGGTQNIVDACVACGVPRLIYTSSASVVFEGKDLVGADEARPYAAKPMDYYTHTKIEGGCWAWHQHAGGSGKGR
jgi:sterol-4alpha-carboxylate 3-dehydrogenase (decarboxylating)